MMEYDPNRLDEIETRLNRNSYAKEKIWKYCRRDFSVC